MKPLTVLGILLMVFAFVILALFIIIPAVLPSLDAAPLIRNMLQAVLCKPGDALTADYSTYDTPTSSTRSMDLSCVDSEGTPYDVSGQGITIGFIGYIVPFLVGLFMAILSESRKQPIPVETDMDYPYTPGTGEMGHKTLAERLSELKSAFDAGLITQTEYEAKRKELLKEA